MTAVPPIDENGLQRLSVEAGLAAEEARLEAICQGESHAELLAWTPLDRALVMPRRHERTEGFPAARQALRERGWPILFRATGGTPVPQCASVVNVALALRCRVGSSAAHLEWGYHRLGDPWCDWLASLGVEAVDLGEAPGAYCDGRFNVRIGGRKLVGTAQRWRRVRGCRDMAMLVHGAMQVSGDPAELVEVVNAFQDAIGDPQRFLADSHVALVDALPGLDIEATLPELLWRLANAP